MKIIGRLKIDDFKRKYPDTSPWLNAWEAEIPGSAWLTPHDVKQRYASASFLPENHIILNIKGGKYRLKIWVNYKNQIVIIKNIGTHDEYMKW